MDLTSHFCELCKFITFESLSNRSMNVGASIKSALMNARFTLSNRVLTNKWNFESDLTVSLASVKTRPATSWSNSICWAILKFSRPIISIGSKINVSDCKYYILHPDLGFRFSLYRLVCLKYLEIQRRLPPRCFVIHQILIRIDRTSSM